MHYKFLFEWVKEQNLNTSLIVSNINFFQDQYVIFFSRSKKNLQINLSAENPFCFWTDHEKIPFTENSFTKNLENYLKHSKLQDINIENHDRILSFQFNKTDIYNQQKRYFLLVEMIPRFTNIILADNDYKIILAKRYFSYADNPQRQIVPNFEYQAPQTNFEISETSVHFPISIEKNTLKENSTLSEVSYLDMNTTFNCFFYNNILQKRIEHRKQQRIKNLLQELKKKERKYEKLSQEFSESQKEDYWKHLAELVKSNLHTIKSGMKEITVIDYFDENLPDINIPLMIYKSPLENMNFYFKKYRKARDGKVKIKFQIEKTKKEIESLKQEMQSVENDQEFIFADQYENHEKSKAEKKLKSIKVNEDWEIVIGRTSKENDYLSTRLGRPADWWFHTRVFRGTHVILRNFSKKQLPEGLLKICSQLAAYYSKAKKSQNVPVDYTQIRYLRKPRGSATGYVTYKNEKTIYVDPIDIRSAGELIKRGVI